MERVLFRWWASLHVPDPNRSLLTSRIHILDIAIRRDTRSCFRTARFLGRLVRIPTTGHLFEHPLPALPRRSRVVLILSRILFIGSIHSS